MGKASRRKREGNIRAGEFLKTHRLAEKRQISAAYDEERKVATVVYKMLPEARCIRFEDGLMASLPLVSNNETFRALTQVHLPFETTFLEFEGVDVENYPTAYGPTTLSVHGALIRDIPASGKILHTRAVIWRVTAFGRENFSYFYAPFESDGRVNHAEGETPSATPAEGSSPMVGLLAPTVSALTVLESINVELVEREPPLVPRRFAGQIPHFFVDIRTNGKRYVYPNHETKGGTFSHRWEVRGHFKHFTKGRVFEKALEERPEKVLRSPGQPPCVRVWCPPFIAGPADKPLLPKIRTLVA